MCNLRKGKKPSLISIAIQFSGRHSSYWVSCSDHWYWTYFLRIFPGVISLQLCAFKCSSTRVISLQFYSPKVAVCVIQVTQCLESSVTMKERHSNGALKSNVVMFRSPGVNHKPGPDYQDLLQHVFEVLQIPQLVFAYSQRYTYSRLKTTDSADLPPPPTPKLKAEATSRVWRIFLLRYEE
jgi:hypothetical protein